MTRRPMADLRPTRQLGSAAWIGHGYRNSHLGLMRAAGDPGPESEAEPTPDPVAEAEAPGPRKGRRAQAVSETEVDAV